jgi:hypothetical protein
LILNSTGTEIAIAVRIAILIPKYKMVASKSLFGNTNSDRSLTGSTMMLLKEKPCIKGPINLGPRIPAIAVEKELRSPIHIPKND